MRLSKICTIIIVITFMLLINPISIYADPPYTTVTEDRNGRLVYTQTAYEPILIIDNINTEEEKITLRDPEDIFIDKEDNIYIADTGNGRIVILDSNRNYIGSIGEGILKEPTGVFVHENKDIYVADYRNLKVYKFNNNGELLDSFGKPDSPIYGKNMPYKPKKVVVDKRGNLYIIGEGSTNGVIQLSSKGEFLGYFGPNSSKFSLKMLLQKKFFTEEQKAQLIKNIPPSPNNIAIDKNGIIYTSTQGIDNQQIKKLNVAGRNILNSKSYASKTIIAIAVDKNGNIYSVNQHGYIFEYDRQGNLLFSFGGSDMGDQRIGLLKNPSGIAVDSSGFLYILDKDRNNIQVYKPTDFAILVHNALNLFHEGLYIESQNLWGKVLKLNSSFDLAHKAMGKAYFKQQKYKEALIEYRLANDKQGYSEAYWEIRAQWLQANLPKIIILVIAISIGRVILRFLSKRYGFGRGLKRKMKKVKEIRIVSELLLTTKFLKHPIDSFYSIKFEKKASILTATILYIILFIEYIFVISNTNFIFSNVDIINLSIATECAKVYVPLLLWVVANYLVSTISDGEGKFSDVYKGTIYALSPYILFSGIIAVISNAITLTEKFIYHFSNQIIIGWSALLLFLMIREIHNFDIKKTFKNIFLTIFTMVIMIFIAYILFVLSRQVFDFIQGLLQEVKIRVQ